MHSDGVVINVLHRDLFVSLVIQTEGVVVLGMQIVLRTSGNILTEQIELFVMSVVQIDLLIALDVQIDSVIVAAVQIDGTV